jgi:hypothetical protein
MSAITLLSLMVGGVGLQAVAVGSWLRSQQVSDEAQREEEETNLAHYESASAGSSQAAEKRHNGQTPHAAEHASSKTDPRLTGWEFKIVRATRDLFRNSEVLQRLCEEEARAGWILLEKLDDRRIRFKRPIALRDIIQAELLPFDVYRSHYGPTQSWRTIGWAIVGISLLLLPAYLGFTLVSTTLKQSARHPTATPSLEFEQPTR